MCLFCDLAKNAILGTELCYFLYDINPVAPGHGLIIPKRHCETVFEMTADEWASAGQLIKLAKLEIDKKYQPSGYNLKINCGRVAGQEVMHAHIHLIPKYQKEKS